MSDTLKAAGRIGAELGAAKAENERLRGLLRELREITSEYAWDVDLEAKVDAALSQQAEPTETYTAVDMATAAAQGFRDGQAAVEQATEQDERKTFEAWAKTQGDKWLIVGGLQWSAGTDDYASARTNAAWAAWQERAARPAQTEQQPILAVKVEADCVEHVHPEYGGGYFFTEDAIVEMYAARPAQTEQQPEQSRLIKALEYYANGNHLLLADPDAWDTCSGEPLNFLHDDAGTASVEDGSIARVALEALELAPMDAKEE